VRSSTASTDFRRLPFRDRSDMLIRNLHDVDWKK
jgi:hypothetical protein